MALRFTLPPHRRGLARRFLVPVLLYLGLQVADATTTMAALGMGAVEANASIAAVMRHGGFAGLFAVKVLGAAMVAASTYLMLANYALVPVAGGWRGWCHRNFARIDLWSYHVSNTAQFLVVAWNVRNILILRSLGLGG